MMHSNGRRTPLAALAVLSVGLWREYHPTVDPRDYQAKIFRLVPPLVFDTAVLLARYEQRPNSGNELRLFDAVSAEFIQFSQHLLSLMSRIPEAALGLEWEKSIDEYLREMGPNVKKIDGT